MFIEDISEEAYLNFLITHGDNKVLKDCYVEKTSIDNRWLYGYKNLYGYTSVEGDIPSNNDLILLYEPRFDLHLVPVRMDPNDGAITFMPFRKSGQVHMFFVGYNKGLEIQRLKKSESFVALESRSYGCEIRLISQEKE